MSHSDQTAAVLINLGSPDSTSVPDVRRYLREFLMDERVIDIPAPVRWLIVHAFILPFRSPQSAEAYSTIWTEDGSPLIAISRKQCDLLRERFKDNDADRVNAANSDAQSGMGRPRIEMAMRYGRPSIPEVLTQLYAEGIRNFFLMPLYPQYAMATWETVVVQAAEVLKAMDHTASSRSPVEDGPTATLQYTYLQPFYADPDYSDALAESARPWLVNDDRTATDSGSLSTSSSIPEGAEAMPYDHLVFSFHGLPERHLRKCDPSHAHCLETAGCCERPHPAHVTCYRHQCLQTVANFVARTGISEDRYTVAFQSRLGRDPWLQPYTDATLEALGRRGLKHVLVICPAFVTDCLETLEEIGIRGRETFQEAGGGELTLIPCLNDHPAWITFLERKIRDCIRDS